jgi:hypothetical protein
MGERKLEENTFLVLIWIVAPFFGASPVGRDTRMPGYVVLISSWGIDIFAFNGFVIGPVPAALHPLLGATSQIFRPSPPTVNDAAAPGVISPFLS